MRLNYAIWDSFIPLKAIVNWQLHLYHCCRLFWFGFFVGVANKNDIPCITLLRSAHRNKLDHTALHCIEPAISMDSIWRNVIHAIRQCRTRKRLRVIISHRNDVGFGLLWASWRKRTFRVTRIARHVIRYNFCCWWFPICYFAFVNISWTRFWIRFVMLFHIAVAVTVVVVVVVAVFFPFSLTLHLHSRHWAVSTFYVCMCASEVWYNDILFIPLKV